MGGNDEASSGDGPNDVPPPAPTDVPKYFGPNSEKIDAKTASQISTLCCLGLYPGGSFSRFYGFTKSNWGFMGYYTFGSCGNCGRGNLPRRLPKHPKNRDGIAHRN